MLGGALNELSNVRVNGKGRRYRGNWMDRTDPGIDGVNSVLRRRLADALVDIERFGDRPTSDWKVTTADARRHDHSEPYGVVICSPPYPNSFDYTDVYNLELWMLGYLGLNHSNSALRHATLSSHVQVQRDFSDPPAQSPKLDEVLQELTKIKDELWSPWIPEMVGAYFHDLLEVFERARLNLVVDGKIWIVVGDSQYKGALVPVADILAELLTTRGWALDSADEARSMRVSPQQGGQRGLAETLLILRRL